jgi:hypothetical protein
VSCDTTPSSDFEPIIQGADYAYDLEVSEIVAPATIATPVNLTGATFRAQLRRTPASSEILASFTPSLTAPTQGKVSFSLDDSVTASIPATSCDSGFSHDVFVTLAGGRTLNLVPLTYISVIAGNSR